MHVSWNWLSEMVDLSRVGGPEKLAELLTQRGLEVEEVRPMGAGLEKVVTVKILSREKHPQADRLSVCQVTSGSGDPMEIVCGAQNMKAGDIVALAQVGASLPNGLKIERSKIRGVVSNGMLCSEEELKLKDTSEGILILPPSTKLGTPLAEILGLDDTILTFKLTANRGDCLSHFGMAREVAAALGTQAKRPATAKIDGKGSPVAVSLEAGELSPQFWGVYIEGVKIAPSPAWVVKRLESLGSRSINNVVDATNLVMLELGHPLHAYDAERIEGQALQVRMARDKESLPLLDGTTIELSGNEIVIADKKRAVGLAGVMGGGNSEVQDGTTRLFLECAEFSAAHVRRASVKHQKKTDAAHRFERGVDPMGLEQAIGRLTHLVLELAGGKVRGSVAARLPSRQNYVARKIQVRPSYFNEFLGTDFKNERIEKTLASLDCQVQTGKSAAQERDSWTVAIPSYRMDLSLKEDLAEEVARSIGYDQIPSVIPKLSSMPTHVTDESAQARVQLLNRAKDSLRALGLNEALNYSFSSQKWLSQFGMESQVRVVNPLSEEHEFMVPSLIPGLVQNAITNWRHHFGSESLPIRLFEIRPVYSSPSGKIQASGEMETGAGEHWRVAMVLSGPRFAQALKLENPETDFFDLKAAFERLLEDMGTRGMRLQPLSSSRGGNPLAHLFHPGQSVEILAGNTVAGTAGLIHPGLARNLKLRAPLWCLELDWEALAKLSRSASQARTFKPWPEFPPMERDFALLVKSDIQADKITQVAMKAGKPLAKVAKVFDIYRGSQVSEGMTSVAVRVIFYDEGRSLQESETEAASAQILEAWKKELGAQLRSS